jgi:hypothetical protein
VQQINLKRNKGEKVRAKEFIDIHLLPSSLQKNIYNIFRAKKQKKWPFWIPQMVSTTIKFIYNKKKKKKIEG